MHFLLDQDNSDTAADICCAPARLSQEIVSGVTSSGSRHRKGIRFFICVQVGRATNASGKKKSRKTNKREWRRNPSKRK